MVTSSPISLRGAVREASRESSIDSSLDHANANDTACDQGITINVADQGLIACAAAYIRQDQIIPPFIQGMTKSCASVGRKEEM